MIEGLKFKPVMSSDGLEGEDDSVGKVVDVVYEDGSDSYSVTVEFSDKEQFRVLEEVGEYFSLSPDIVVDGNDVSVPSLRLLPTRDSGMKGDGS